MIDKKKFLFDFLLFTDSTIGYYDEAKSLGATIFRLPKRKDGYIRYRKWLDAFFKENASNYVAIHWCGCSLTSISPIYYAKKYGIPIRIVHTHSSNTHGLHNKIFHYLNRYRISSISTHAMACSDVAAKYFFRGTKLEKQCAVVKNGIDLDFFQFDLQKRLDMRNQLGISDEFVIGHVGRFTKVKNHNFLLDVFVEIIKQRKALLLLIGEGEIMDEIKVKVLNLGLQNSVRFLGVCDNVNDILQAMDCFLFPSFYEGLPFALVEAQAAGLPIYTSTNVSSEVNITNNVTFISLEKDAKFWASEILSLEFARIKVNDKIIKKGYSIKDTVDFLEEVYSI